MKYKLFLAVLLVGSTLAFARGPDFPYRVGVTPSTVLFEESLNRMTGFSVDQNHSALSDWFDEEEVSQLCGPTAIANMVIYQKMWGEKPAKGLLLPNPYRNSYVHQVKTFASLCGTNRETGTKTQDMVTCLKTFYRESGYPEADVKLVHGGVDEIREYLKQDYGLILNLERFKLTPDNRNWEWVEGHFVNVIGYDWDRTFGNDHIVLKVVDPRHDYRLRESIARFDRITMHRFGERENHPSPLGNRYLYEDTLALESVYTTTDMIVAKPNP